MASDPETQLHHEFRTAVASAHSLHRPILRRLNADSSWLLQFPRPPVPALATRRGAGRRPFYNVLIDPWLSGGQSDYARWFSQQWHAVTPALGSISEVQDLAKESEVLAVSASEQLKTEKKVRGGAEDGEGDEEAEQSYIDAVAVSHEFTDHCHKETLLQLSPNVPVFANDNAAKLISSWSHFHTVITIPPFPLNEPIDWTTTSLSPLPPWLSITRLQSPTDALYYHSAILFTFSTTTAATDTPSPTKARSHKRNTSKTTKDITNSTPSPAAEAIVYTAHGLPPTSLPSLTTLPRPVRPLALLHGLHDVRISGGDYKAHQLNLGAHNGLAVQRLFGARYWVATHDEVKKGGGLMKWFINRNVYSVADALVAEVKKMKGQGEEKGEKGNKDGSKAWKEDGGLWEDVSFVELGNGEALVLR